MPAKTRDGRNRHRAGGVDTAEAVPGIAAKLPLVAIVGNPNAGKTTLFNALTGSHQKVGNYPGVTVEKVSCDLKVGSQTVECVDVPGLYSVHAVSSDEEVAVQVLRGAGYGARKPDLLVCVVNADNLERNLFFVSQLAEEGFPMVVAVTMTDLLRNKGEAIDVTKLSNLLGTDVVEVVGHKGKGLTELNHAIERNLENPRRPTREFGFPVALDSKAASLRERMARAGFDYPMSVIRSALLEPDTEFEAAICDTPELWAAFQEARRTWERGGHGGKRSGHSLPVVGHGRKGGHPADGRENQGEEHFGPP